MRSVTLMSIETPPKDEKGPTQGADTSSALPGPASPGADKKALGGDRVGRNEETRYEPDDDVPAAP